MKKIAATLLLITLFVTAQAQRKAIDSLKKLIPTAKDDTTRALLLNQLSRLYQNSKPDSAMMLCQQEQQLSLKAGFLKGEAYSLNGEGTVFNVTGNCPKALNAFLSALRINEKRKDRLAISKNLGNIGTVYTSEGDYRQAINYSLRSKTIAETIHARGVLVIELLNLGDFYEKLNILDSARIYTRQAYEHALELKDIANIGGTLNNLGNIWSKMHKPDSALYYYRKAIPLEKQADYGNAQCETFLGMAKIFGRLGMQDSSLYYARQSIATGQRGGFTSYVLSASQFLTGYFEQQGRLDSAYRYQKVFIAAKDSLYSQEKTKEFQNLSFAERQRQADIQERDATYKANVRSYLLVAVILFLLVLAFIFWRNNRKNEKARRLLQIQKEQIQTTLGELKTTQNQLVQSAKMASLGELTAGIAHEIQNPLNFVNNFSDVNREMIGELKGELKSGNVEEALVIADDIEQNEVKINHHGKRADFIVKGMLEHSRNSTGERQVTNINVLADEFLKLSYHGLRAKDKSFNADLVTHFDPSLPKLNVLQQDIGRVLINLFGNAFYAVNQKAKTDGSGYKPTVEVSTAKENGSILIKVKDNGDGIPDAIRDKIMQPFFTTKPTGEGTGLGLSLSYDIVVKGHGGSINVDTNEGEFTEFTVALPLSS